LRNNKLLILKIGGSVITEKSKVLTSNLPVIKRLAREIAEAKPQSLIIVHGGGSYGHPLAERYKLRDGLREPSQRIGFSETHEAMVSLNRLVVNSLLEQNVPALGMPSSSFAVTKNGRIHMLTDEPLIMAVKNDLIPVLYGDVVFDIDKGFTILSGDQIAALLAVKLHAERIIMGVDVDGLYTSDPKVDPSAILIPHLTLKELEKLKDKIGGVNVSDVTGGMAGKVLELMQPIAEGVQAVIVNALRPNSIYKALKGEELIGTRISKT